MGSNHYRWSVLAATTWKHKQMWVLFWSLCPASSSYCECYDWVVQLLMMGGSLSFAIAKITHGEAQQPLVALTMYLSVNTIAPVWVYRAATCSSNIIFLTWANNHICGIRKSSTAVAQVGEKQQYWAQTSTLLTAGAEAPELFQRGLLSFTQGGDSLHALKLCDKWWWYSDDVDICLLTWH